MIFKIVKATWIGVAILVLLVTLYAFDGNPSNDIGIFFVWSMMILSFPSGLIVSLMHVVLYEYFSITIPQAYLSLTLSWVGFFILGYLQWFTFVPYLIRKLHTLKNRGVSY